jgi:hypothetical protein
MQTAHNPRNILQPPPPPFEFSGVKDNLQSPQTYQSNRKQRRTGKGLYRRPKSVKIYRQIE